jgi:hypothetical protein
MPQATTEDQAKDFGWNVLTGIPLVGTVASGIDAIHNIGTIIDPNNNPNLDDPANDEKRRAQATRDLASDCLSIIPLVGTATSIAGAAYDVGQSGDTWGNLTNQLMGGPDQYAPTPQEMND